MPRARKNNVVTMSRSDVDAPRLTSPAAFPHEVIARRAYEIFERRGGVHGADLDDWLQAEQQLRDETAADRSA